jgi:hypothetical protein
MILVSVKVDQSFFQRFISADFWSRFMSDVCVLGLKVSGFGLVFVLSKRLFEEIYLRIGGEGIRIVFSFSFLYFSSYCESSLASLSWTSFK